MFIDAKDYDYGKSDALQEEGSSTMRRVEIENLDDSSDDEGASDDKSKSSEQPAAVPPSRAAEVISLLRQEESDALNKTIDLDDTLSDAEVVTGIMSDGDSSDSDSQGAVESEINASENVEQLHASQQASLKDEFRSIVSADRSDVMQAAAAAQSAPCADAISAPASPQPSTSAQAITEVAQNDTMKNANVIACNTDDLECDVEQWENDDLFTTANILSSQSSQSSTEAQSVDCGDNQRAKSATPRKKVRIELSSLNKQKSGEQSMPLIAAPDLHSLRQSNQAERQAEMVSEKMIEECKELLQLFGIPYVESPTEAESQCAALEFMGLTDGTITDDSDIWLFGGQKVYKNFFAPSKYVDCYKASEIEQHYKLDRESMICFALLTGSDYTTGVEGVGPVTAIEILNEFRGKGLEVLQQFRQWCDAKQKTADKSPGNKVRAKWLKLKIDDAFPSRVVYDAYMCPAVDSSTEKFTWARPDLDLIRQYARRKLGWKQSKVDELLLPALKKLNETQTQTRIDSYFQSAKTSSTGIASSKRVAKALKLDDEHSCASESRAKSSNHATGNSSNTLKEKVKRQRVASRVKRDLAARGGVRTTASKKPTLPAASRAKANTSNAKNTTHEPTAAGAKERAEMCLSESSRSSDE